MWIWASTPSSTVPEGNNRPFTTMLYRAVGSYPTVFLSCLLRQPWTKASTLAKVALGTRPHSLLLYLPSWKFPLSTKQIIIIINHQSSFWSSSLGKGGRVYSTGVQTGLNGVQERSKRICGSFFAIGLSFFILFCPPGILL